MRKVALTLLLRGKLAAPAYAKHSELPKKMTYSSCLSEINLVNISIPPQLENMRDMYFKDTTFYNLWLLNIRHKTTLHFAQHILRTPSQKVYLL